MRSPHACPTVKALQKQTLISGHSGEVIPSLFSVISKHLTFASSTAWRSRQCFFKVPFLVERPEVRHRKRAVGYRSNKWSPNVADASYSCATENTLDGVFSEVNTNTLDSCLICLVNVSLLSTNELHISFED
jgi:hypothetical protein